MILSPNKGTIYDGSMTYTASADVSIVVLHEMDAEDAPRPAHLDRGRREPVYGWTLFNPGVKAGSFEYTGAALAFHTGGDEFVVTASVDGWIRGEPTEISLENPTRPEPEPYVKLARSSVPATMPLHAGLYDGERLLYVLTDASDAEWAEDMSERQEWRVEVAPPLGRRPRRDLEHHVRVHQRHRRRRAVRLPGRGLCVHARPGGVQRPLQDGGGDLEAGPDAGPAGVRL